uniref:Putative secretory peptide-2 n=1 Tax=Pleurobrachia bachei TaxID=34499 RepID=M4H1C7_PLEBA|nr:putative secretory peptide-2 [Pleurobrachia bachei]|eukprot:sb/3469751/
MLVVARGAVAMILLTLVSIPTLLVVESTNIIPTLEQYNAIQSASKSSGFLQLECLSRLQRKNEKFDYEKHGPCKIEIEDEELMEILMIDREEARNSKKQRVVCRCRKAKARRKSDKKRAMLDGFVNPPSTKKKLRAKLKVCKRWLCYTFTNGRKEFNEEEAFVMAEATYIEALSGVWEYRGSNEATSGGGTVQSHSIPAKLPTRSDTSRRMIEADWPSQSL